MKTFRDFGLDPNILKALAKEGYTHPTPIQEQAIPILLKGHDLLGSAQTGTGKTAAFALPIIQHLLKERDGRRSIKALVVTPTRELAIQISDNFKKYSAFTNLRTAVIFGGVKQGSQVNELDKGVDILIATPGRLLDLVGQKIVDLSSLDYFVLDEADQMLDMGFIHDIKRIIRIIPQKRQSLFFSATMPKNIIELSKEILGNYKRVSIAPEKPAAERVSQVVYRVAKADKPKLLVHLLNENYYFTTLVFSRTKHGADKIVRKLKQANIKAEAIHGNKSQNARQRTLKAFKDGKTPVLVATDIAARGIDVEELSLVVNYDLPNVAETYVHRIGRTGRAKASGISISFCDDMELKDLWAIEELLNKKIERVEDQPYHLEGNTPVDRPAPGQHRRNAQKQGQGQGQAKKRQSSGKNFRRKSRRR